MPYFDYNATTPLAPAAREAWLRAADEAWQNPSSPYRSAARVRNLLEADRAKLAELLGCAPSQVVFNSGATEGVNAVFEYCAARSDLKTFPTLLSPIEHPCVLEAAERFFAGRTEKFSVPSHGRTDPEHVGEWLAERRFALVSVMAVNNETGIVQPWGEIAEECRSAGALFHCDAAQWSGKLSLEGLAKSGFVTAAAHKFGGPKGCGFMILPAAAAGFRGQVGGEQEHGLRAGTENYPSIAAMVAALEETDKLARNKNETAPRQAWRERFEQEVLRRLPGTRIAGGDSGRLWNTVSLILPTGANDRWVRKLDRAGFQVSTGSACSTGEEAPSHVLAALGFSPEESKRAIRISSGWSTPESDWNELLDALEKVYCEVKQEKGGDDDGLTEVIRL